ncbi:hypothetical protein AMELA_G00153220, partial [Ameiurus melas]
AEYLIEIEIDTIDVTIVNQLRGILQAHSLPTINSNISVTDVNITTVCSLNGTEYQCRCEVPYFWPCEKCKLFGSCGNDTNSSCDCINALPNDGHFCQPINELTNNSICQAVTTAPPLSTTTESKATNRTTAAPSIQTPTNRTTATASIQTTTIRTTAPSSIQTTTNGNTTTPSIQTTTTAGIQVLSFSLTINEVFDSALSDQSSEKFKTYKQKISRSIDNSYRNVHSYEPNSATVTAFRPGSVITDFTISTTSATLDLASANQDLASSLRLQGFNVSDNAFSQSVKDGLYESSGNIYPGTNLTLTCNPPVNNSIQWTLDGKPIAVNSNNTLQLDN